MFARKYCTSPDANEMGNWGLGMRLFVECFLGVQEAPALHDLGKDMHAYNPNSGGLEVDRSSRPSSAIG